MTKGALAESIPMSYGAAFFAVVFSKLSSIV
jgi:hypothetical protein